MTVSPSPSPSPSKSQIKQKCTWEIKRKLAEKRLMSLTNISKKLEESVKMDKAIVCRQPEERTIADLHSSVDVSAPALQRAEEIQANLPLRFPTFLKSMLRSHVTGGFWLGLPRRFCVTHLPKQDETIVLVDENGQECDTRYLAAKNGLSGGWRGFAIQHNLLEGDVLVFQLIEPCKFKIFIVRARKLTEVDGATSLLNLSYRRESMETVKMQDQPEEKARKSLKLAMVKQDNSNQSEDNREEKAQKPLKLNVVEQLDVVSLTEDNANRCGDDNDDSSSQIMDVVRFLESRLSFKDVKSFKDFNAHIDGLIIDSEIPSHVRLKYYELCSSQNMFLHENLVLGLNTKLIAGIISETINIADAIRVTKPSCDLSNLESWDRTLGAFEDLGMFVGFLRTCIHKLLSLSRETQAKVELKRKERCKVEEEIRELKMKLSNAEMQIKRVDGEIDDLKVKNEKLVARFKDNLRC